MMNRVALMVVVAGFLTIVSSFPAQMTCKTWKENYGAYNCVLLGATNCKFERDDPKETRPPPESAVQHCATECCSNSCGWWRVHKRRLKEKDGSCVQYKGPDSTICTTQNKKELFKNAVMDTLGMLGGDIILGNSEKVKYVCISKDCCGKKRVARTNGQKTGKVTKAVVKAPWALTKAMFGELKNLFNFFATTKIGRKESLLDSSSLAHSFLEDFRIFDGADEDEKNEVLATLIINQNEGVRDRIREVVPALVWNLMSRALALAKGWDPVITLGFLKEAIEETDKNQNAVTNGYNNIVQFMKGFSEGFSHNVKVGDEAINLGTKQWADKCPTTSECLKERRLLEKFLMCATALTSWKKNKKPEFWFTKDDVTDWMKRLRKLRKKLPKERRPLFPVNKCSKSSFGLLIDYFKAAEEKRISEKEKKKHFWSATSAGVQMASSLAGVGVSIAFAAGGVSAPGAAIGTGACATISAAASFANKLVGAKLTKDQSASQITQLYLQVVKNMIFPVNPFEDKVLDQLKAIHSSIAKLPKKKKKEEEEEKKEKKEKLKCFDNLERLMKILSVTFKDVEPCTKKSKTELKGTEAKFCELYVSAKRFDERMGDIVKAQDGIKAGENTVGLELVGALGSVVDAAAETANQAKGEHDEDQDHSLLAIRSTIKKRK